MRIIAGTFKGKKILEPKDNLTRPLKDLTKESIFNILNHSNKFNINLENSNILDLFSGVGSFGIECISRGVKHVVFVEKYNAVLPILKKNLQSLKSNENYEIIERDIYNINFFKSLDKKLNILDLTNDFLKVEYKKYFINDKYGGHLNKRGNQLVSRIIEKKIIYENNLTK